MGKLRVLVLGDEGVALFLTNGKKIERECSLPWLVPNFEDELISVLKAKNSSTPVFILYDALEQQYRKEDIVKTNILDQQKLVKRKLSSLFPNVLAYAHIHLKPGKKDKKAPKSKHNSYLIAAIPQTEHMKRIQYVLTESRVDISGMALLPVESSSFANTFMKKITGKKKADKDTPSARWTLMISHHETGGLRQIFTKDGTLALTRLTPLSDNSSENANWAEEVYREYTGTMSYISRFGFNPNDGLDIIVICNEQNKQLLKTHDFKDANLHLLTIDEAYNLFGFSFSSKRKNPTDQYADLLHAGWLARQRRLKMPFKIDWIQSIAIPRKVAKSAAALMFIGILALGGLNFNTWQKYLGLKDDIAGKESQKTALEKEYDLEAKIFDVLPVRPQTVRVALELKELMEKKSIQPPLTYQRINSVFRGQATLLSISLTDNRDPDDDFTKKRKDTRYGFQGIGQGNTPKMFVTIRFRLEDTTPLQEKVQKVEGFKENLESLFPGYEAEIIKQYGGNAAQQAARNASGVMSKATGVDDPVAPAAIDPIENYAEIQLSEAPI